MCFKKCVSKISVSTYKTQYFKFSFVEMKLFFVKVCVCYFFYKLNFIISYAFNELKVALVKTIFCVLKNFYCSNSM